MITVTTMTLRLLVERSNVYVNLNTILNNVLVLLFLIASVKVFVVMRRCFDSIILNLVINKLF